MYCVTLALLVLVWRNQTIRNSIRYGLIAIVLLCSGGQVIMNVAMYNRVAPACFAIAFFVLQMAVMFSILLQLEILKLLTALSRYLDMKKLNYCQYFVVLLWLVMIGGPQLVHMPNVGKEDLFINGWTDFGNTYFPLIGLLYSIFNVIYCSILIKRAISIRKINATFRLQSRHRYRHYLYLYVTNIVVIITFYMLFLVGMLQNSLNLQLYWGTDTAIRNIGMNGVNLHLLFIALLYQKMLEATFPDRTLVLEYLESSNEPSLIMKIPTFGTISRMVTSFGRSDRSRFWRRSQPASPEGGFRGTMSMPRLVMSTQTIHRNEGIINNGTQEQV
jgi:hypothetical protein